MDLREIARQYMAFGLCPLPASPATKFPKIPRWNTYQKRRMTDLQVEANFADAEGICLITGAISDSLEMIDFDAEGRALEPWLAGVKERFPDLPAVLVIEKSKSGGRHVYYRSENIAGNTTLAWVAEKKKLIETRGEGGLVVCYPTPGYELIQGSLTDIPRIGEDTKKVLWEIALGLTEYVPPSKVARPAPTASGSSGSNGGGNIEARVRAYLETCDPAISGCDGHDRTFAVVRAVVWGFDVGDEGLALSLLQAWNQRCEPPWSDKDLRHKIKDANTLPYDKPRGYLKDEHDPDYFRYEDHGGVDLSNFLMTPCPVEDEDDFYGDDAHADPGPFPENLFDVPGFVEQVMHHNLSTSHKQQPVLALAGALCLQAILAARKIRDSRNNRTCLYVVSVSDSGSGKEHARGINTQILFQSGCEDLQGPEECASDAGLVAELENRPALLMQIDEFGKFLKCLANPAKAPHLFSIISVLLKLYSSCDRTYLGKAYANRENNKKIHQPNLVLHATGVPSDFFDSLTPESLSDGLVGRFLVFEGDSQSGRRKPTFCDLPKELLDVAKWWKQYQPAGGGNLGSIHPEPTLIHTTADGSAVFDALGAHVDSMLANGKAWEKAIWSRAEEKACRLALVYAASANKTDMMIDGDAARWACSLSEYLTRRLVYLGRSHISHGLFDSLQKKVMAKVRDNGGGITGRDYTYTFCYWDKDTRQKVLANLLETGQLLRRNYASRTKKGVEYVTFAAMSTKPGSFVNIKEKKASNV